MFETFEHTADVGIRARAPDMSSLLAEPALGMFSLIVANLDIVLPEQELRFEIAGDDRTYLLFDWLSERLFTFAKRIVLAHFNVEVDARGLMATARGEPIRPDRHMFDHEIKAITDRSSVENRSIGTTSPH